MMICDTKIFAVCSKADIIWVNITLSRKQKNSKKTKTKLAIVAEPSL